MREVQVPPFQALLSLCHPGGQKGCFPQQPQMNESIGREICVRGGQPGIPLGPPLMGAAVWTGRTHVPTLSGTEKLKTAVTGVPGAHRFPVNGSEQTSGRAGPPEPVSDGDARIGWNANAGDFLDIGRVEVFQRLPGVAAGDQGIHAGGKAAIEERPDQRGAKDRKSVV